MFKPFFLSRARCSDLSQFIGDKSHHFIHQNFDKIGHITLQRLQLVQYEKPIMINPEKGIPFDLPAMIVLLQQTKKKFRVIDFLTEHIDYSDEAPLILFCGGSMVDGQLPYIEITPEDMSIKSIPLTEKLEHEHCYQLHYTPAAAAA